MRTKPGLMDETEISKGASSSRSAAPMASTACFVPEYTWAENAIYGAAAREARLRAPALAALCSPAQPCAALRSPAQPCAALRSPHSGRE